MSQPATEGSRLVGHVKWFDAQKGWGFIQPTDGSDDVFVHQQSILAEGFRSLDDGEEVEYEVETDGSRRKRAVNVTGPGGSAVKGSSRNHNYGGRGGRGGPFHQNGGGRNTYEGGSSSSYRGNRRGGYNRYDDQQQSSHPRYEEHRFERHQGGGAGGEYESDARYGGSNEYGSSNNRRSNPEWERKPQGGSRPHADHPQMVNQTYGGTSSSAERWGRM
eukprot:Gregarina_sp_Pseudo_9__193@NODE_1126_length_1856_cov_54_924051_g1053_i0_p1_GENE_NODE_1126_length_1856_cov_54_924051_g1053_i0NODE_1126_length_1856_cov_54_924051_g1053_i0_p1_ORF_typecomplete_len218_score32_15CSD/PF00313_22/2_7e25OB_RNB/PF08206_11/0_0041_NODE_1126_length_1856_cov_54_924051_g1053_i011581811